MNFQYQKIGKKVYFYFTLKITRSFKLCYLQGICNKYFKLWRNSILSVKFSDKKMTTIKCRAFSKLPGFFFSEFSNGKSTSQDFPGIQSVKSNSRMVFKNLGFFGKNVPGFSLGFSWALLKLCARLNLMTIKSLNYKL